MASVVANLMVADVEKSVAFYRDRLGFEVVTRVPTVGEVLGDNEPDQPLIFATLKLGSGELMLQSSQSFSDEAPGIDSTDEPGATMSVYLRVDNLDDLIESLGDAVNKPPKVSWYGMREIWASDPDGYLLTIGQLDLPPQNIEQTETT